MKMEMKWQKEIRNGLSIEKSIILMKMVMVYQIVKKDYSIKIRKSSRLKVVRDLPSITLPQITICKSCQFDKKTKVKFNAK